MAKEKLAKIASSLHTGQFVAVNLDNYDSYDFSDDPRDEEFMDELADMIGEEDAGEVLNAFEKIKGTWPRYTILSPMSSHEAYKVMESFAETLENEALKREVFHALEKRSPFANFRHTLASESKDLLNAWYDYEQAHYAQWVEQALAAAEEDDEEEEEW
jgi:hypothetical protein